MKDFLNKRMYANKNLQIHDEEKLRKNFDQTVYFINSTLGKKAFRVQRGIHTAIFDSVMVAIALRLMKGNIADTNSFLAAYEDLLADKKYDFYINTGTSDENNITNRIRLAIKAFEKLV